MKASIALILLITACMASLAFGAPERPGADEITRDLRWAGYYLYKGEFNKAEELLNPIFNHGWEMKGAGRLLIEMYRKQGRTAEERVIWNTLRLANPANLAYLKGYAEILLRDGDIDRALRLLDTTKAQHNADFQALRDELTRRRKPAGEALPAQQAEAPVVSVTPPVAESVPPVPALKDAPPVLLVSSEKIAQESLAAVRPRTPSATALKAERCLAAGEYAKAEELLNPMINRSVDMEYPTLLLITGYSAQGRLLEERSLWSILKSLKPKNTNYLKGYLTLLLKTGGVDAAARLLDDQRIRDNREFDPLREELARQRKTLPLPVRPVAPAPPPVEAVAPLVEALPSKTGETVMVTPEATSPEATYERGAFALLVNGEKRGEHFVLLQGGDVFVEKAVLEATGFKDSGKETTVDGTVYSSLATRATGLSFEIDDRNFQIRISAEPSQFKRQEFVMRGDPPIEMVKPTNPSAFINYDILATHDTALNRQGVSIPHEMGIRYGNYLLFSSYAYTKPANQTAAERYVRLYSNLIRDDRNAMVRYTLGDFNATSGTLGGGTVMAGVNVARNFGMNPYYIRTSGLSIGGAVENSSDVEIYRNGMLMSRRSLAPGFFDLQDLPLMDGSGDVTLVIKDAFGRERRIDMPYTVSQEMLRKGVHDFSYSAGIKRNNIGIKSADYDGGAMLLRHRYGLTDYLTVGGGGEYSSDAATAGISATATIPRVGTLSAAAATSWAPPEWTSRMLQGHAYRFTLTNGFSLAGLFYTLTYGRQSNEFATVSQMPFSLRSLQDFSGSVGIGGNRWGSLSFYGSLRESNADNSDMTTLGTRYSIPLFRWGNIAANVAGTRYRGATEWTSSLTLNSYLGAAGTANIALTRRGTTDSLTASLQKSSPNEEGPAYRFSTQVTEEQKPVTDNEFSWYGPHGVYSAGYQSFDGSGIYAIRTSGSIATLFDGSGIHFGRPVYDSFALVKVDNLKDVPVYQGGRIIGTTNAKGEVFAPSVTSYGDNPFMVRQNDLPFNYSAPALNKSLSPSFRSGSRLVFDVDRMQAMRGTVFIVENGKEFPADFWVMTVQAKGKDEVAPLVKDGEFYLENIPAGSHRVTVAKEKKRCEFSIVVPASDEAMIDLGKLVCNI